MLSVLKLSAPRAACSALKIKAPPLKTLFPYLLLATASASFAETVKDREGAIRGDRAAMEQNDRWIYNDVERGFAEAQRTGRPLLVVLRCVPCKACMGIDASILSSDALQPLLAQFVCVRVINANALDLTRFQFDYDLSFSTLFFNADGTTYGRYGSWQHQRDALDATTAGYRAGLEAALAIHRGYPANRPALASKQPVAMPFQRPIEFPALAGKYERELNWQGNVVKSCVHCHQIGDANRAFYREKGEPIPPTLIYPMPMPETLGLTLDPQHVARVTAVAPGSAAARAGLAPGDDLLALDGAPPISIADFAWSLHRGPASGTLPLTIRRGAGEQQLTLPLAPGWREQADISTRVGTWPIRAMATGGLLLISVSADERTTLGLPPASLALRVKHAGQYGPHGAAKAAGFQKDDILIAVDGLTSDLTESALLGQLLTRHPRKEAVPATVLRAGQRIEMRLPMQ